jgi:hypothetical protein
VAQAHKGKPKQERCDKTPHGLERIYCIPRLLPHDVQVWNSFSCPILLQSMVIFRDVGNFVVENDILGIPKRHWDL